MQTVTQEKVDIQMLKISSPVLPPQAWQLESFLLKILEYGDYSFRKALTGRLSSRLQNTFFIAQNNCNILAAAGSLYTVDNPAVAILGPVCVEPQYRQKGLAGSACRFLLSHLEAQGAKAVYLGVRADNPAAGLYCKLGFETYSGIVMRKLFVGKDEFDRRYSPGQDTVIRKMDWQDFAEVSVLLCEPAKICSFDFGGQVFSSMYADIQTFLPVFPSIMECLEKNRGFGVVLQTMENKSIVGTAFLKPFPPGIHDHIAVLEFFVLDGFIDKAVELVSHTIKQSGLNGSRTILCYCPQCDIYKKQILLMLGAEPYAVLPDSVRINDHLYKTIIYKLARKL